MGRIVSRYRSQGYSSCVYLWLHINANIDHKEILFKCIDAVVDLQDSLSDVTLFNINRHAVSN